VHPPLRDGVVDGVCCYAALHMFADPGAALASFARVLRPGGRLTLLTSARHPDQPLRALDTVGGRLSGQRMFERDEIAQLLADAGLVDVRTKITGVAQFVAARRP
jgi:SAM-dependent methyltransferase